MITLFRNPKQIITIDSKGKNYKRGKEMNDIGVLENHSLFVEDGKIKRIVGNSNINKYKFDEDIDLCNKIILPGLVECHTHTAFAGSRAEEFKLKLVAYSW